ncbi:MULTISPECIES: flagellar motor switch protein FliN [Methylobacterium]|jgi:flagellar motor switch protein FliN/FliY|uniref:Flagellar motor switch protein FliN n=2 Tax=Methylobacterium TaxID=407 RepID=A0A0C6F3J8_9HYPH|nr:MULTISPECIES: flagellar motor switch protein FliN [Methylobacterium]MBZ6414577.1 flagellar motor switch protein FliN [Methylobacterium sp.]BAQ47206.1 flagellar motor switch protein FliN [Methylobacterium aquaticum]SEP39938.1 flagellar motor switch protein FliN/FliY [Methylobacterium sp. ap11]SFF47366.1 flagellar motor switch protein FliN/FliY [Methylobacterium sp. yr596]
MSTSPFSDAGASPVFPSQGAPQPGVPVGEDPRNLDSILRIPVLVQVVLGSATMPVANLMKLGRGAIVALDHRVGEPVDIMVNGRVIARGEIVIVEEDNSRFGVSLTEVVGPADAAQNG